MVSSERIWGLIRTTAKASAGGSVNEAINCGRDDKQQQKRQQAREQPGPLARRAWRPAPCNSTDCILPNPVGLKDLRRGWGSARFIVGPERCQRGIRERDLVTCATRVDVRPQLSGCATTGGRRGFNQSVRSPEGKEVFFSIEREKSACCSKLKPDYILITFVADGLKLPL